MREDWVIAKYKDRIPAHYLVSNTGKVFRAPALGLNGRVKKQGAVPVWYDGQGYPTVSLRSVDGQTLKVSVHRLMAESWIRPLKPGECVCHVNDIKTDNRLANLVIGDHKLNSYHRRINGIENRQPLTRVQMRAIEMLVRDKNWPRKRVVERFGVTLRDVSRIMRGRYRPAKARSSFSP